MSSETIKSETHLGRRDFVAGAVATLACSAGRGQNFAGQATQPKTRVLQLPGTIQQKIKFTHNGSETFGGFIARPDKAGVYPGVLVVAGNKISEEYIPNTCAALALADFVGLAPDIFHPLPDDTPSNNEAYAKYLSKHTELDRLDDLQVGASYLRTLPYVSSGGIGAVGFCRGGREAMLFGARSREVEAVVAFHPAPVTQREIQRLRSVPVQIHHGTADESVPVASSKRTEELLRKQGTPVEAFYYEGANHGFLAYTRPFYQEKAAQLAWDRAVSFLQKNLKIVEANG